MEFFKTVFRQKNFMFKLGIIVCLLWVIVAFIAPLIAPADPLAQNLDMRFQPPGAAHWFGTDSLGRDVFSRVLYGSRISITAGLITVLISFGIGLLYGGVAGYVGGIVDDVMMRFSEMIQSFPPLILAMVIAAAMGPSIVNSVFAMAIIWWPNYARLTRSIVISVKENDYVTASRLMGASRVRILFREILPIGQTLTEERTGERYEVMGYIPKGSVWVEEDDLIRFPVVSLDGWFLAPFSGESRSDIMTQLSCLHNTYVFLADGADTGLIREQIAAYPRQHGFAASSRLLSEEYGDYQAETRAFTTRHVLLAGFITVMAVSSVTAVFAVSALLKRQQYGIWMACGFSRSAVAAEILLELFMVLLGAGLLAWGVQGGGLMRSTDLFRGVLLRAHTGCTLPACILLAVLITGMGALIPLNRLFRTSPGELIKGGTDTSD